MVVVWLTGLSGSGKTTISITKIKKCKDRNRSIEQTWVIT